jgi:hypothetical protein
MNNNQTFDEHNAAFGLDLDEVRQTASRQLLASLVVAVLVLASAALMPVGPSHQDSAGVAQQRFTARDSADEARRRPCSPRHRASLTSVTPRHSPIAVMGRLSAQGARRRPFFVADKN